MNNVLLSCEHGGHRVPRPYRWLFRGARALLHSHRGWDIGALAIARALSRLLGARLCASEVTRLLVDLNRSLHHRALFSERSRQLPPSERERIVAAHYLPHRTRVQTLIGRIATAGPALHLAIHSFTPVLNGQVRAADIGLLYDPARPREQSFCRALGARLRASGLVHVRMNYPYRGAADGLTTQLRATLPEERYLGVEIEINQRIAGDRRAARPLADALAAAIQVCAASHAR